MKLQFSPAQKLAIQEMLDAGYASGINDLRETFMGLLDFAETLNTGVAPGIDESERDMTGDDLHQEIAEILAYFGFDVDFEKLTVSVTPGRKLVNRFKFDSTESRIRVSLLGAVANGESEMYASTFAALKLKAHIEGTKPPSLNEAITEWTTSGIPAEIVDYITALGFMYDNGKIIPEPVKEVA